MTLTLTSTHMCILGGGYEIKPSLSWTLWMESWGGSWTRVRDISGKQNGRRTLQQSVRTAGMLHLLFWTDGVLPGRTSGSSGQVVTALRRGWCGFS